MKDDDTTIEDGMHELYVYKVSYTIVSKDEHESCNIVQLVLRAWDCDCKWADSQVDYHTWL